MSEEKFEKFGHGIDCPDCEVEMEFLVRTKKCVDKYRCPECEDEISFNEYGELIE